METPDGQVSQFPPGVGLAGPIPKGKAPLLPLIKSINPTARQCPDSALVVAVLP